MPSTSNKPAFDQQNKAWLNIGMALTTDASTQPLTLPEKLCLALTAIGLLILGFAGFGLVTGISNLIFALGSLMIGGIGFAFFYYKQRNLSGKHPHNGLIFASLTARGAAAWITAVLLTFFYVLLYWYPQYLGLAANKQLPNTGLIGFFDPLSLTLKKQPASQWFVYGTLYTLAIFIMGVKFILKYQHNRYQIIRTISVMFFQTGFAFLLPEVLQRLQQPYFDFKNIWPLNYYFFFDWHIDQLISSGKLGVFMLGWGVFSIIVLTPVLTYFFGKRWYCSWVCGCGGLAETAGDPFRHLSNKKLNAWRLERWLIHGVLIFVFIMTAMVLYTRFTGQATLWFLNSHKLSSWYGFFIGAAFSGVIGVGFYPLLGSRVWCRFGCPMAAILGILQKYFSRFRITTNGGQCISCGNCSTYCEMGIDVRAYAQRGQDVVRAACVGCGICAAVCPRGVLKLENGKKITNNKAIIHVRRDEVDILFPEKEDRK